MDDGIVSKFSNHSVEQTVEKLKEILQSKGITLFALIDHSGEAERAKRTREIIGSKRIQGSFLEAYDLQMQVCDDDSHWQSFLSIYASVIEDASLSWQ